MRRTLPFIGAVIFLIVIISGIFSWRVSRSFYNNQLMVDFIPRVKKCYNVREIPRSFVEMTEKFKSNVQAGTFPAAVLNDLEWVGDKFYIISEHDSSGEELLYFVEYIWGEKFFVGVVR
jgi:hypothetical protein